MSRCTWLADGEQCEFPGTRADSTLGDCRWFCAYHYRSQSQAMAAQIVEASQRWDDMPNKAEAWLDRRKREVYANDPPSVKALRERLRPIERPAVSPLAKWLPKDRQPGEDDQEAA